MLAGGWGIRPNQEASFKRSETRHRGNSNPGVLWDTEPVFDILNTRRTLKEQLVSAQTKPYVYIHGGKSRPEEVCTYLTVDGGQIDGYEDMVDG